MSIRVTGWWATLTIGLICTGCSGAPSATPATEKAAPASAVEQPRPSAAAPVTSVVATPAPAPAAEKKKPSASATMTVKRLVVASGVSDREPVLSEAPLLANGTPIYAFAELTNPDGESENVRITFERKGGKERAGDVVLPVPGKVTRHRTWAFTRHIFAPGQWDAVLRSESGRELGRTSFDVKQG